MTSLRTSPSAVHRLRLLLAAALLIVAGLALGLLSRSLPRDSDDVLVASLEWAANLLIFSGGLGILLDVWLGRHKARADQETLEVTFDEKIPEMARAMLLAVGESQEYLRGIASPELLDAIATNALSLRLGDDQFAREIYADVRDQAIRAPERWYDVEVDVRLSTAVERSTSGAPAFEVLVSWEYTVVPSHPVARFACVSDRDEFYELTMDSPATSTWFMTPRPGFDASRRECFELLSYSVDGEERKIRRSARKTGQTYSVTLGEDLVREGRRIRVRHLYRVITPQSGHRLFFEVPQPARGVALSVDYTNARIAHLSVSELVTSIQKPRVARLPVEAAAKVVQVDIDGWLLPRAGFTCVWTLESELAAGDAASNSLSFSVGEASASVADAA